MNIDIWRLPRTRLVAKTIGATRYFTAKECKYGHMASRTTSTARCEECNRIFNREHKRRQAAAKGEAI